MIALNICSSSDIYLHFVYNNNNLLFLLQIFFILRNTNVEMSAKAIREAKGKQLLSKYLSAVIAPIRQATYATHSTSWEALVEANPWLLTEKLVVKPDQLIKRRGKLGLVLVNVDLEQAKSWIATKAEKEIMVLIITIIILIIFKN